VTPDEFEAFLIQMADMRDSDVTDLIGVLEGERRRRKRLWDAARTAPRLIPAGAR